MKNLSQLLILTSPPASGKTYWIKKFKEELSEQSILVISPLRALREECHSRWRNSILVMTPEEWISKKVRADVVIFDEFHLHFYWGDSFRPLMWEVFYELTSLCPLSILLTATLSSSMLEQMENFRFHFDEMTWIDCGNQRLKTAPVKYIKAPSYAWLKDHLLLSQKEGVQLIFCQYRSQVEEWGKLLRNGGFNVLTCVGGEAAVFREQLMQNENPDFIVSTTVLSHGVNLPQLTSIYFFYPVENLDFWIQMVARGGRQGEAYQVFALENPQGIKWNRWLNLLAILGLSLKMKVKAIPRDLDQCFLKELS